MSSQQGAVPVLVLKEGSNRSRGKEAQNTNIEAAKIVAEAVKSSLGPKGMAKMLNAKRMAYAHMRGIDRVYMFTFDAEKFAFKLGFRKIDKKQLPESIRTTWQFRRLKFYPVACMMKRISPKGNTYQRLFSLVPGLHDGNLGT